MENYAQKIRRELHMYPEVGFELENTLKVLRRELDSFGVEYTEKYGKSSIVATVNPEKSHFTIGIRADMDALPITEENDVPYKSKNEGKMHACGHDAHTATVLEALRRINGMRDEIDCRVKFIFQAAEEFAPSGAMLMARDGAMDGVDCIISLHCDSAYEVGNVGFIAGDMNAISDGFTLDFYGKSAHVANQEAGIDAIMMAHRAYTDIEFMVAKEIKAKEPVIFNVGAIHGGVTNNIICNHASMFCTLRTWDDKVAEHILGKIKIIGDAVAKTAGGRFEFTQNKHYPKVYNNPHLNELLKASATRVLGEEHIYPKVRAMGGEDFSYFANIVPGCMFRLGCANKERGIVHSIHTTKFDIDERALDVGASVIVRFVLDNMSGIDFN